MYDLFGGWQAAYQVLSNDSSGLLILGGFTDRFNPNIDTPVLNAVALFSINKKGEYINKKYFYKESRVYFTGLKPFKISNKKYIIYGRYPSGKNRGEQYFTDEIDTVKGDAIKAITVNNSDTTFKIRVSLFCENKI